MTLSVFTNFQGDTITGKNGKVINGPLYQPEADSFMKLDDIRGEFDAGENEKVDVTYRLKDVIITSFDNSDALTNYRPEVFSEGVSSPAGYTNGTICEGIDSTTEVLRLPCFFSLDASGESTGKLPEVSTYFPDVVCVFDGCGPAAPEYLEIS